MSNEDKSYYYEVVASYVIQPEDLETFVENYKFKPDKYIVSVQKIEHTPHCCDVHKPLN
jgi:hypothetical protein